MRMLALAATSLVPGQAMQRAAASHSSTQLCSRFPKRVQQARAGRVAPRAVRTRAAADDAAPRKRRYVKDEDMLTAEKDLYSLARASYGGQRGQEGAEDMFSGSPIKDEMAWFAQPKHKITAKPGSLEAAVQRVLYNQPDNPVYKDRELILLEDYLKHGVSSNYVLVRGLSARARLEEERQLHNPTPLGENTKPYERAVCELALEMQEYGGTLPDVMVEYPASYFSRRPKPPASATEPNAYPFEWVSKDHFDPHACYSEVREEDAPGSYFVELEEEENLLGWTGEWPTDSGDSAKPQSG